MGEDKAGKDGADVSMHATPGRADMEGLVGLPRTYIDTCGLELFRDENPRCAQALLQAEVDVECHLYSGAPHDIESAGQPNQGDRLGVRRLSEEQQQQQRKQTGVTEEKLLVSGRSE